MLYAHNSGALNIPQGLTVPWENTLCKRALEENLPYTADVPAVWGDSDAARDLGLKTYVSTAIRLPQGQLYGTLCAASGSSLPLPPNAMPMLQLFASLIGQQVEREMLLHELQMRNKELATFAMTDALTGMPNRRALMEEIPRMWARAQRESHCVLLAYVDLDGFKGINDQYGHDAGDQLLMTLSRQFMAALRDSDFAARVGGDEFVMVGVGPALAELAASTSAIAELQHRLSAATQCDLLLPATGLLRYPGASVGVVAIDPKTTTPEQAMLQGDAAMYDIKSQRRNSSTKPC